MPEDTQTTTSQTAQTPASETPASFEAWIGTQPENVQALYTQHVTGLKNTVGATRKERDDLAQLIKDLQPKAEKGSQMEKDLQDAQTRLEQSERRATFYEDAAKPEIGCRRPNVAYALAMAESLFDRKGAPDWAAIKQAAPELFGQPGVNANAGAGTQNPPKTNDMNSWIRRAAGR